MYVWAGKEEGGRRKRRSWGCPISWEADLPPGTGDESTTEDKEHVRGGSCPPFVPANYRI